jgi:ubiquinone/menaquinone biosynthesis C-methylase UbiE
MSKTSNFWDELMGTDEGAGNYMETYGEGPGCDTRNLVASFVNEEETVLDVGCGPGWNLDHFTEYGPTLGDYRGLDYSERFVRVANKRAKEKYDWAPFYLGDVRDFGEPDDSWDVVILQDVLEHTNGYEKPMEEAMRVATKRIIITFWKAFRKPGDGHQINDDGNDGYGATYESKLWEEYLDSLGVHWIETETKEGANRYHQVYVIDKEIKHGA